MRVRRQKIALLAGVVLATLVPLAPVGAHTVSLPMTRRSEAGGQIVLRLQITGAYRYTGTLTRRIDKNGTGCFAGKGSRGLAYVMAYNASYFSSTAASSGAVLEAGALPYKPGSTSPYRGNRTVAVAFTANGTTYQAGLGESATADSLELDLTAAGRQGSFMGTRIPSKNHKTSVLIRATWNCPSVLAPPAS